MDNNAIRNTFTCVMVKNLSTIYFVLMYST